MRLSGKLFYRARLLLFVYLLIGVAWIYWGYLIFPPLSGEVEPLQLSRIPGLDGELGPPWAKPLRFIIGGVVFTLGVVMLLGSVSGLVIQHS